MQSKEWTEWLEEMEEQDLYAFDHPKDQAGIKCRRDELVEKFRELLPHAYRKPNLHS
jgi:hypothetical protein